RCLHAGRHPPPGLRPQALAAARVGERLRQDPRADLEREAAEHRRPVLDPSHPREVAPMTKPTTKASNNESRSWRELVSTHRLATAVLAGILATHIATITAYWYHATSMPHLHCPSFSGYPLVAPG